MEAEQPIEKRALLGSIANGLSFVFTFFQSVVLVPVFLNTWGKEKYGAWIALYSFITLIRTIDLGHQNYVGNEINKVIHTDVGKVKVILGSSFKVAYLLGLVELLLGCIVFYFFGYAILGLNNSSFEYANVFWANFSLLFIWFLFGSIGGILARVLISIGKFSRFTYWGIAMKMLETIVLLLAAFNNFSILHTALTLAVSSVIYYIIQFFDFKLQITRLYPWWENGSFKLGLRNLGKAQLLTLTGFIDQFSNSFQVISVSNFLGSTFLPVFTTLKTLTNIALQVVVIFSSPLNMDIIKFYIKNERDKLLEIFSLIWIASLMFVYIPFVILTPFVQSIYRFWTHNLLKFDQHLYYMLALSVCVFSFGTPLRLLLFGINHLRSLFIMSIARLFILCVIPFGINKFGLSIVGIAVLNSEIIASIIIPYFFTNKIFLKKGSAINKYSILLSVCPLILIAFFFYFWETSTFFVQNYVLAILIFAVLLLIIFLLHWRLLTSTTKTKIIKSLSAKFNFK